MIAIRRAALRLRELRAKDRVWMLEQLDSDERARIEPLLDELDAMEVPGEEEWLAAVETADSEEPPPESRSLEKPVQEPDGRCALTAADGRSLAELLADQPDCVIAALLASDTWAWRDRFLKSFPRARRRELKRRLEDHNGDLSPAVRGALAELAGQRLREGRPGMKKVPGFEATLAREQLQLRQASRRRRSASWRR